ncbi:MAG: hypothetical protein ABJC10_09125 [Acidobacteriota bacterium]
MRKRLVALAALGVGVVSLFLFGRRNVSLKQSLARGNRQNLNDFSRQLLPESNIVIDDHGTDQIEAAKILRSIRDAGFDSSNEKLALVLGRPTEEIAAWASGSGIIDGDAVMKARGLARERGIQID